jgi:RNA polymerase sigma factor (sigma-70 family)
VEHLFLMHEDKLKEFDDFFSKNYSYLKEFSKSIDPKYDYEDLLHQVYLKCRNRIQNAGFQNTGYLNYTRCSIMNTYKTYYRENKKNIIIDINDKNYYDIIEDNLIQIQEDQDQEELLQYEFSYINTNIFEYVQKYYNQKENFVFRTYYLLKHKHLNYKTLSQATGYSITSVSKIIKKIKKDIKINLQTYLKTGMNIDEFQKKEIMDKLLEETKKLIQSGQNWNDSKILYEKITGTQWTGCKCKKSTLYNWIINWYNQNSNI